MANRQLCASDARQSKSRQHGAPLETPRSPETTMFVVPSFLKKEVPVSAVSRHDEATARLQENFRLRKNVMTLVGCLPGLLQGHVHGAEQ